jgi:hypothetical protein
MKDIEQYKKRFYNLMESTMGDAKPLINEQMNKIDLTSLGFQKWGQGFLLRLPVGSTQNNDSIRIEATPSNENFSVVVAVQSNKKVRSEINGNNIFKDVQSKLGHEFSTDSKNPNWENTSNIVSPDVLKYIVDKLKVLKVDNKNNMFI